VNRDLANFAVCERTPRGEAHFQVEHATLGQRLLWSLDRLRGESGALNCPALCSIEGPLDIGRLHGALRTIIAAHPSLRATIVPGRTLLQKFSASSSPLFRVVDLGASPDELARSLREEFSSRIDPERSATRISVFKVAPDSHVLVLNMHHLFTDLWSSNVLLDDLAAALRVREAAPRGRDRGWDFVTYSRWERQCMQAGGFARQQRYWFERLAGLKAISAPLAAARSDANGSRGLIEADIAAATRERLESMARARQASPFAALLAVLFAMIWRRSGDRDLAVASLFANRSRPELSRTVGFLVNMLMLRVRVGATPSFGDFVDQSQRASAGALANADLPFHALSPPPATRGAVRGRADDFVFHATTDPIENRHDAGDLQLRAMAPEVVGRFDLELAVRPSGTGLLARLTYNEGRLSLAAARCLLNEYVHTAELVGAVSADTPLARAVA
jgi:hypothetical protein